MFFKNSLFLVSKGKGGCEYYTKYVGIYGGA